jgi:hypothetical protein
MRHRTVRAIPALALALAAGISVGGCTTAAATARAASVGAASASPAASPAASSAAASAARTSAAVNGPFGPDEVCVAALRASQTLQGRQLKDENNQSALDQDFTNFANALSADAQHEKRPAAAKAMAALSSDYTALVESQSGGAQLPDVSTVQNDGTAFDKACANS